MVYVVSKCEAAYYPFKSQAVGGSPGIIKEDLPCPGTGLFKQEQAAE